MLDLWDIERLIYKDVTFRVEKIKRDFTLKQLSFYDCLCFNFERKQLWFDYREWIKKLLDITDKELLFIDINKFVKTYEETALREFYWKEKPTENKAPDSFFFYYLSKENKIDVDKLIKTYTPEWIKFLSDWLTYYLNEQTEDWRETNRLRKELKGVNVNDEIEKTRLARENYLLRKNKNG
jgi:hypothetical protein